MEYTTRYRDWRGFSWLYFVLVLNQLVHRAFAWFEHNKIVFPVHNDAIELYHEVVMQSQSNL